MRREKDEVETAQKKRNKQGKKSREMKKRMKTESKKGNREN